METCAEREIIDAGSRFLISILGGWRRKISEEEGGSGQFRTGAEAAESPIPQISVRFQPVRLAASLWTCLGGSVWRASRCRLLGGAVTRRLLRAGHFILYVEVGFAIYKSDGRKVVAEENNKKAISIHKQVTVVRARLFEMPISEMVSLTSFP